MGAGKAGWRFASVSEGSAPFCPVPREAVRAGRGLGVDGKSAGGVLLLHISETKKHKIAADFYIKTLHHHKYPGAQLNYDSMWCSNPEETVAFMRGVQKPWIAFKVLAAGAIPPDDAFRYAFDSGADFVLAGMYDFEIAEDVQLVNTILASLPQRVRA